MRHRATASQAGFSLVEMLMAMVITLIVTGAIYGLLSGGQSAFRVQPERTERQQNIRNAMDAIMRDVATAGVGLPDLAQVFTPGLDGAGAAGPSGPTDILEMATNPDNFPNEPVCGLANTALNLQLKNPSMSFASLPRGIFLWTTDNPPRWAAVRVTSVSNVGALGGDCAAGPSTPTRPLLTLATSCTGSGFGNALVPNCTMNGVLGVGLGDIVRYDVRVDPADNVPSLWRSHPLLGDPAKDVLVARGIEDLQVEYIQANMPGVCDAANPCANAPLVSLTMPPPNPNTDYNTIITQVQVTLSARSNVQGLQGQTKVGGQAWLRGSLTSVGSPRAALYALNMQQPLPPGTPPLWQ